jgi:hypothetical protein
MDAELFPAIREATGAANRTPTLALLKYAALSGVYDWFLLKTHKVLGSFRKFVTGLREFLPAASSGQMDAVRAGSLAAVVLVLVVTLKDALSA